MSTDDREDSNVIPLTRDELVRRLRIALRQSELAAATAPDLNPFEDTALIELMEIAQAQTDGTVDYLPSHYTRH
jgi:hypothetical protein